MFVLQIQSLAPAGSVAVAISRGAVPVQRPQRSTAEIPRREADGAAEKITNAEDDDDADKTYRPGNAEHSEDDDEAMQVRLDSDGNEVVPSGDERRVRDIVEFCQSC